MQAQNTSRANGGQVGIYQKADTDPNFRADDDDVLGYWNCSFVQNTTFPADFDKGAYEGVIASLQQSGLLYNTSVDFTYEAMPAGNKTFTAWSPSALNRPNDLVRKVWDVKACREVSQNGTFAPIPIMCFYCNMNAPYAEWIVELMEAGETLSQFTGALFGAISDANDTNIDGILASMLEAITMVGSEPRIPFSKAPVGKGILEITQGCLAARAEIPWPVFLILVVP
jgi:hypothetical protein